MIEAVALAGIAYVGAGRYVGLGRWWERTAAVRRFQLKCSQDVDPSGDGFAYDLPV